MGIFVLTNQLFVTKRCYLVIRKILELSETKENNDLNRSKYRYPISNQYFRASSNVDDDADSPAEKVAQTALVQADDNTIRFIGRVSLELPADYADDNTTKLWTKPLEFSNVVLPEAYKQD